MRIATRMEKPALPPNICCRCRCTETAETKREYFVDVGVSFDWEGVVYLCDKCLEDICKATGEFFTKVEVDELLAIQVDVVEKAYLTVLHNDDFKAWVLDNFSLNLDTLEQKYNESRLIRATAPETDGTSGDTEQSDDSIDGDSESEDDEGFVLRLQ